MNIDPTIRDAQIRLSSYKQSVDTLRNFEKGILKLANSDQAKYVFKKPKGFIDNKSEIVFESNKKNFEKNKRNQSKALDTYSNIIRSVFNNIPTADAKQLKDFIDIINDINSNFLVWAGFNVEVNEEQLHITEPNPDPGQILQKLTQKIDALKAKIKESRPRINPHKFKPPESFDFTSEVLKNNEIPHQDRIKNLPTHKSSSSVSSISTAFSTFLTEAEQKVSRTMQNFSIRRNSRSKTSSTQETQKAEPTSSATPKFSIPSNIRVNSHSSLRLTNKEMLKKAPQSHLGSMLLPPNGTESINSAFWRDLLRLSIESVHINGETINLSEYHNKSDTNAPIELLNTLISACGDLETLRMISNICHQGNCSIPTGNWVESQTKQNQHNILVLSDFRTNFENLRSFFKIDIDISGDTINLKLKSTMQVLNPSNPEDGTKGFGIALQQITLTKDPATKELTISKIVDAHSSLHLLDYDFEDKNNHQRFLNDMQAADKNFELEVQSAIQQIE